MAEYMKKLVYLTEEQKDTLFANGSITVGGKTITYDPNDVYVTPRDLPDFQVGTVETLSAGSQATASITGTGDTPVINLGIPKGDQGIQGPQGVKGDTGAKGDKGDKGDQGNQGPQGVKGDTGAKGDKGDKGDTGNTGPVGLTPDLTIGTVQTLPAGSSATATITGTAEDPVLNLGIPKGDQGEVTQAEFDALADDVSDMQDTLEHKADIDGYYTDMTVGNAEQLVSSQYVEDAEPYKFRTSGGSADIGNREYLDKVVGGTVAWNQQVRDEASENQTDYADVVTVTDAVIDDAAVKVKVEPVQDLHGQDSPWPAGGGVNKFAIADAVGVSPSTGATYGLTITLDNTAETIRIQGTPTWGESTAGVTFRCISTEKGSYYGDAPVSHDYSGMAYKIFPISLSSNVSAITELGISSGMITVSLTKTGNAAIDVLFKIVIATAGTTIGDWTPYSNICPITGWDGVKVSRSGGNLWDEETAAWIINNSGEFVPSSSAFSSKNPIPVTPGQKLYVVNGSNTYIYMKFYDSDLKYINVPVNARNAEITVPNRSDIAYMHFSVGTEYGRVYKHDIAINYPSTITEYNSTNTYDITLPTEAGTVYGGELTVNADGSGSLVVNRAEADAGTMNWTKLSGPTFWAVPSGMKLNTSNIISSAFHQNRVGLSQLADYEFTTGAGSGELYVHASVYTDATSFKTAMSGVQLVYELANPITYSLTASQVQTLLGTNHVWSDAGQVALTYTGTDEHLVLTSGRKYLTRISGTDSVVLGAGQEVTAVKGRDNVFDLTQMFGTSVADYVYQQGAGFFRRWFGGSHYAYNAGELLSVEGLQSRDTVGFNQWDEQWEVGAISNGVPVAYNNSIRSKNYCECLGGQTYYGKCGSYANEYYMAIWWYDENKDYLSRDWIAGTTATSPVMARYFKISTNTSTYVYGNTYNHDICINLSHNSSRNGEYQPYEKHSYPLDSTLTLRGIPKLDANNELYYDGDEYESDGTVTRKYGVLDLGTATWYKHEQGYYFCSDIYDVGEPKSRSRNTLGLADTPINPSDCLYVGWHATIYCFYAAASTASELKSAFNGKYIIYELATPTDETATPYQQIQHVDDWGTEEFVSTSIVPVGHATRYPANLRDKLQHLPALASANGSYLITQTDGQMVLTPFPAPPTTAGNYLLKATVSGGNATYSWVAQ